jgi:hypothetical protein
MRMSENIDETPLNYVLLLYKHVYTDIKCFQMEAGQIGVAGVPAVWRVVMGSSLGLELAQTHAHLSKGNFVMEIL